MSHQSSYVQFNFKKQKSGKEIFFIKFKVVHLLDDNTRLYTYAGKCAVKEIINESRRAVN